ncbi:MAG: isoleucine--tRNA ligase [Polyangiales bacterium]
MFEAVSPQLSLPALEEAQLAFWQQHRVFDQSLAIGDRERPFVFFEGPPTANGMPHPGSVLTRVMKDVFLRYQSMCGRNVPRRAGWDTHGLPVEVEVEKELGISGRQAIEAYGVEAFTRRCIDSVFRYIEHWRQMTQRIGFWVDLDSAYVTFHKDYVESVWWALAQLHARGLLYQDYKVVWWWPQGGTALSSGEVGQGYREVEDPSVVVRFPLVQDAGGASLLAWTTTPWTLPPNVALAVKGDEPYLRARLEDGEEVILAAALADTVLAGCAFEERERLMGCDLVGRRYQPPFAYVEAEGGPAHQVITADFVTLDSGTGVVHVAPAFGEDDFRAVREHGLGFLQLLQPDGCFPPEVTDFAGQFCKDADKGIIRWLKERGRLFASARYTHEYPFCWRKDSDPLIQYARRSWFVRTTSQIDAIIANNQAIGWEPKHIRDGRFGSFLRGNVDWALSRERFWGTPLPIWVNDVTGQMDVVASVDDILARNPAAFAAFDAAQAADPSLPEHLRVHKPWIDQVSWQKEGEAGTYRRVPEVIDCWFDSGAMPFAQWGYPHSERSAAYAQAQVADMITEGQDQTRGWFYALLAISTLLFPERKAPHPFKHCLVLSLMTDAKGQKLSKSKRNYDDPMQLIAQHGADAMRFALLAGTVPGQASRFHAGALVDALRECLLKWWNSYSFFATYARIDGWQPPAAVLKALVQPAGEQADPAAALAALAGQPGWPARAARSELDRWVLAELEDATGAVHAALRSYRSHVAARRLGAFVDAVSNWYLRRSRGRFWSGQASADKEAAYATLYQVLVQGAQLMAPFVPFIAEAMYQNLVRAQTAAAPVSIHLTALPKPATALVDTALRRSMAAVRAVVSLGQRVRAQRKIKLRQPLRQAVVVLADAVEAEAVQAFSQLIAEELNVHTLSFRQDAAELVDVELVPNFRALGPKLGTRMPLCKRALAAADGNALHAAMQQAGQVELDLADGSTVQLSETELQVRLHARGHYAAASDHGRVVLLDFEVDAALYREGLAREVINRIQRLRKDADLPYDARITVRYAADGELGAAIAAHGAVIARETLATELAPQTAAEADAGEGHSCRIDEMALQLWWQRAPGD